MIKLPKINRAQKEIEDICKCRPICKSRRRVWKVRLQNTPAEQLLEEAPLLACYTRCPTRVFPNSSCPLFGRTHRVLIDKRDAMAASEVVRICQAPIDDTAKTPYLAYAEMAKTLGAWRAVHACCPFCSCGACCTCSARGYVVQDADRVARRCSDMRAFDARVKTGCREMRIMYDKL